MGASWAPLGASWGLLGASWGLLGASWGTDIEFSVRGPLLGPLLGPSWGPLGPSWAPPAPSWALLGASWAVLGQSWRPLGPSWSVGKPKTRKPQNHSKTNRKPVNLTSWGPLGSAPGGLWGRLAGLSGRLETVKASWTDRSAIRGPLGLSWASWRVFSFKLRFGVYSIERP